MNRAKRLRGPERRAVRRNLHRIDDFAEGGGPGVEVVDAPAPHPLGVEVPLHRVHFDHRVADRRAGGEGHPVAGVLLVQIAGLHEEVERSFAAAGLDAGDALHLRRRFQVLVVLRLVDEHVVDAEFIEDEPVVFLVFGKQVLQPLLARGLLLLDGLDEVAVAAGGVAAGSVAQQTRCTPRSAGGGTASWYSRDMPMRSNELWVTMMPSHSPLAILAVRILRRSGSGRPWWRRAAGVGVELHELAGELLQHVVRHDVHRLLDEARLLQLHAGGGHRERLAGADNLGEQRVARTHAAPDGVPSDGAAAGSSDSCRGSRGASRRTGGAEVVVRVVVEPHEPLGPVGIAREPRSGTAP